MLMDQMPTRLATARSVVTQRRYPNWIRQWQFWVVLGLAAVLRLVGIAHSPFGLDPALAFLEVARSSHDHVLPVTGMYASILVLSLPAYAYIILPFANHPFDMALITALANIAGVTGVYILGEHYFSRQAGFVAGLLMATGLYDTWMSEFLWQPTLIIPVTVAALYFLYRGAVARKRFWVGPHLILLTIAIQVHPIAASLVPLTVVGIVLGWSTLTFGDAVLGVAGSILLLLPTMVFEVVSGGIDVPAYRHWLSQPKVLDGQVIVSYIDGLGPRPADYFGPTSYTAIQPDFLWLGATVAILSLLGFIWLSMRVILPIARQLRAGGTRTIRGLLAVADDAAWRAHLLLLLWPVSLLAMTIRHSSPVYPDYAYVIDSVAYLTIGVAAVEAKAALRSLSAGTGSGWTARSLRVALDAIAAMPLAVDGVIVAAQLAVTGIFIFVFASGSGYGWSWSGVPILSYERALAATTQWAARLDAREAWIVADPGDPYMGLYWAQRQNNVGSGSVAWSSYVATDCVIGPPSATGGVMLSLTTQGFALQALLHGSGARLLETLPMARGTNYSVYALAADRSTAPGQATLNGEIQLNTASVAESGADMPARLVTTWTVLQTSSPNSVQQYHFHFLFQQGRQVADAMSSCTPSNWAAGERIVVVTPLPADLNPQAALEPRVIVSRDTHSWYRPRLGPFPLDTAKELTINSVVLPPGSARGSGVANPDQAALDRSTVPIVLTASASALRT